MLETFVIILAVFWFGLVFGSFVNALVWRLHNKKNFVSERSECVHCHHKLAVRDLIPVFSWLALRGKCRYCKKKIDDNPIVELTMGLVFVALFVLWPIPLETFPQVVHFGLWLLSAVLLQALFVYDLRWKLLPDKLVFTLIAIAIADIVLFVATSGDGAGAVLADRLWGLVPVTGLYGLLYYFSKGRLVGFGDVKLGIFIGLMLGWQAAFLVLFIANVIGTLFVVPMLALHKVKRTTRIPFGPFLIIGTYIALLFGEHIIDWYLSFTII